VGDEVVAACAPEHDLLRGPQAAQLDREHDGDDERHKREGAGRQRDEAGRFRQVVHWGEECTSGGWVSRA